MATQSLARVPAQTGSSLRDQQGKAPYVPTPVAKGNLLFLWSDFGPGSLCEGRHRRRSLERASRSTCYGSPVRAGDKLFCVQDNGKVICLSASEKFQRLGIVRPQERLPHRSRHRRRQDVRADVLALVLDWREEVTLSVTPTTSLQTSPRSGDDGVAGEVGFFAGQCAALARRVREKRSRFLPGPSFAVSR